jgi:hypothetical protein
MKGDEYIMGDTSKTVEEMIESGELSVMTECAYGKTVADSESNMKLKKSDEASD